MKTMLLAAAISAAAIGTSLAGTGGPVLSGDLGPVVPADNGWVQNVWAGPLCDFFSMHPSGRVWAVERGKPWHDGIMAAATSNFQAWLFYRVAPSTFKQAPTVVVSASTSPPLASSPHPGYDQVPTYAQSLIPCGSAVPPYTSLMDSAIAVLPGGQY